MVHRIDLFLYVHEALYFSCAHVLGIQNIINIYFVFVMIFVVLFFEKNIVVYQIFILHKPALLPAKTTLLSGRKDEQTIL